jgi:hypothetical protein
VTNVSNSQARSHSTGSVAHEINAQNAIGRGEVSEAQVYAILALASAVNRLAVTQEAIADAQTPAQAVNLPDWPGR